MGQVGTRAVALGPIYRTACAAQWASEDYMSHRFMVLQVIHQPMRAVPLHVHACRCTSRDLPHYFFMFILAQAIMRARCSKFAPRIYSAITRFAPWLCGASLKLLALTTPGITPWRWWMKHRYQMPSAGSHSRKMEGIWHSRRSLCSSHPLSTRMGVVHTSTISGVR